MALPQRLEVALTQAQLAVLIGVVELIIGEVFKNAAEFGFSWYRRWILDKKRRYRVSSRPFANGRHTAILNCVLIAFITVVIVLELSIKDTTVRSTISRPTTCFGPDRPGRYLTKGGPRKSELNDDRIDPYIIRSGCGDRLFENTLQGPTAIDRGYPKCLPEFGPVEDITFNATLQGCGVGYVARSLDGDYHCDLLPVEELERTQNSLQGTNFLGIYTTAHKASDSYFVTEGVRKSRYISNTELPKNFFRRRLPVNQSETVRCAESSLECYNRVRPTLLNLNKTRHFYDLGDKILFIKALGNTNTSSICVLSSGNVTLLWSHLEHIIPGTDRTGRTGPVLTDLMLKGRGKCTKNLAPMTARLYYDSIENLDLSMKHRPRNDSDTQTLDRTDPVVLLKVAAVHNGLKVTQREATDCEMWLALQGSVMDTGKFIAAVVFSLVLICATLLTVFFSAYAKRTCLVRVDPLDPLWPVRHLLHSGSGTFSSSVLKRDSGVSGDVPSSAGSVGSNSGSSSRRESTNEDNELPQVPHAELGQRITPPRQPRLGHRVGSGSTVSPQQGRSRRISLQSPVSFPLVDGDDEGEAPAPRCISRRVSFRSPIVRGPGQPDDDLWIGIQEDPEERIGRFMPHASATFESLRSYPRQIQ